MSARSRMTMRARVMRNSEGGRDPDNNPLPSTWAEHVAAMPCWLWSVTDREHVGDVNAMVEDLRMLVPVDATLTSRDEIDGVTDRRGQVVDARRMRILADQAVGRSHRELVLQAVTTA